MWMGRRREEEVAGRGEPSASRPREEDVHMESVNPSDSHDDKFLMLSNIIPHILDAGQQLKDTASM